MRAGSNHEQQPAFTSGATAVRTRRQRAGLLKGLNVQLTPDVNATSPDRQHEVLDVPPSVCSWEFCSPSGLPAGLVQADQRTADSVAAIFQGQRPAPSAATPGPVTASGLVRPATRLGRDHRTPVRWRSALLTLIDETMLRTRRTAQHVFSLALTVRRRPPVPDLADQLCDPLPWRHPQVRGQGPT